MEIIPTYGQQIGMVASAAIITGMIIAITRVIERASQSRETLKDTAGRLVDHIDDIYGESPIKDRWRGEDSWPRSPADEKRQKDKDRS